MGAWTNIKEMTLLAKGRKKFGMMLLYAWKRNCKEKKTGTKTG